MPGGTQSSSGTSTTTVQSPQPVNPTLNSLYTSLFGQAAPAAMQELQSIGSGKQLTDNISSLYQSLQQNSQSAYQQGIASIKAAAGAGGTALSSATGANIGNYANQYTQQLNQTATQMGLQEETQQLNAAGGIISSLTASSNAYYSPGSTTSGSQQTSMPWTSGVMAIGSLFA